MESNKIKTSSNVANYLIEDLPEYEEIVDTRFTFDTLYDYNLNTEQSNLCNYLLDGYNAREIAKIMNVSHTTIYNRINKIGKILLN